jgi:hypothetical protein
LFALALKEKRARQRDNSDEASREVRKQDISQRWQAQHNKGSYTSLNTLPIEQRNVELDTNFENDSLRSKSKNIVLIIFECHLINKSLP